MQKIVCRLTAFCFLSVSLAAFAQSGDTAVANQEKVLYAFKGFADGGEPWGRLIFDQAGNLYGTTLDEFGQGHYGTVFELSPKPGGGWSKKILYRFQGGVEGDAPEGALVFDQLGNLYGTTGGGGQFGFGTVFELISDGKGGWTETVLHSFDGNDGYLPVSSLVFDKSGHLYGMTPLGGNLACAGGCGVIFKLTKSNAGWQETVLHSFTGGSDGYQPLGALIFDQRGNLYGAATATADVDEDGVVFRLQRTGGGWKYRVLHNFYNAPPRCKDGNFASEPPTLLLDKSGNLYGPAAAGGPYSCAYGTIWRLTPSRGDGTLKVLYDFRGGADGSGPQGSLTFDKKGNLYGVTPYGGVNSAGTLFKLTPNTHGQWHKTVLHNFNGAKFKDGDTPVEAPILDGAGNLFGTTIYGGFGRGICSAFNGCGVIYQVTP